MSKYIFIHVDDDGSKQKHVVNHGGTASDIISAFYYFLLGVSFHPTSVKDGLQTILEEHKTFEDENE